MEPLALRFPLLLRQRYHFIVVNMEKNMGVLRSGRDLYSTKYINAEITDAGQNIIIVPIKHVLGDYFIAKINDLTYAFRIDGRRIHTWKVRGARSIQKLYYNTANYMPISPEMDTKIGMMLEKNGLPRIERNLLSVLKYVGKKEKKGQERYDLVQLFEVLTTEEDRYAEQVRNMRNFLEHLNIDYIVTPVRPIVEYIEDTVIATDPNFLGDTLVHYQRVDAEDKKVTNTPVTAKKNWALIIAIIAIIGVTIFAIIYLIQSGAFAGIMPDFGGLKTPDIMSQYGTPESLKAAIDRGEISYDSLPDQIKRMVDSFKPPVAVPVENKVVLGSP